MSDCSVILRKFKLKLQLPSCNSASTYQTAEGKPNGAECSAKITLKRRRHLVYSLASIKFIIGLVIATL